MENSRRSNRPPDPNETKMEWTKMEGRRRLHKLTPVEVSASGGSIPTQSRTTSAVRGREGGGSRVLEERNGSRGYFELGSGVSTSTQSRNTSIVRSREGGDSRLLEERNEIRGYGFFKSTHANVSTPRNGSDCSISAQSRTKKSAMRSGEGSSSSRAHDVSTPRVGSDCSISAQSRTKKSAMRSGEGSSSSRAHIKPKPNEIKFMWMKDDCESEKKDGDYIMLATWSDRSIRWALRREIADKLLDHQIEGLQWFWKLHCTENSGGIVADDMGLGKTRLVSSYLVGLFSCNLVKRVLIIVPGTLLEHWNDELQFIGIGDRTKGFYGTKVKQREDNLVDVLKNGGVLLTSYDRARISLGLINGDHHVIGYQQEYLWDYVIIDEGHNIKNDASLRGSQISKISSGHRILMTGTPIQNNLEELWALLHFCCPKIFPSKAIFLLNYVKHIDRGNLKNASDREKRRGSELAKELHQKIKPYFLRRKKSEVFLKDEKFPKKTEFIVWLKLTNFQRRLYEAFLNSHWIQSKIRQSSFAALKILKDICDDPTIIRMKCAEIELNRKEPSISKMMAMTLAHLLENAENESCKIQFILYLLGNIIDEGHSVLIFSQTIDMLDFIQSAIILKGYAYLRIDGKTKISDRQTIVKEFQDNSGPQILLLSTLVGVGLTMTKANRVIIVNPAWNPSIESQSIDRAYRIGQERDVLVYRLITCGTVEEKMYRKQIFKCGLSRIVTENKNQTKYFSDRDLGKPFRLPEKGFDVSVTKEQLELEHGEPLMNESLMEHIDFLKKHDIVGISDHGVLFSKVAELPNVEFDDINTGIEENLIIKKSRTRNVSSKLRVDDRRDEAYPPKHAYFKTGKRHNITRSVTPVETLESCDEKIRKLRQLLRNEGAKFHDHGEKLERQIRELEARKQELEARRRAS